jgi:hypothetical protein
MVPNCSGTGGCSRSVPGVVLDVTDHLCNKRMSLRLGIGRNTLSPAEQCAHIKRPFELVKAAEWFFYQRSPFGVYKRPRHEMMKFLDLDVFRQILQGKDQRQLSPHRRAAPAQDLRSWKHEGGG